MAANPPDPRGPEPLSVLAIGIAMAILGGILYLASGEPNKEALRYFALAVLWLGGLLQTIGAVGLGVQYGINHSNSRN